MFYDQLKKLCDDNGTTPTSVTEKLGMSKGTVKKKKKGGIPNGEALVRFSEHFKVSIDYLMTGKESTYQEEKNSLTEGDKTVLQQLKALTEKEKYMLAGAIPFIVDYQKGIKPDIVSKKVISISEYSGVRKLRSLCVFDMPSSAGTGLYLDSDDYTTMDFDSDIIPHGADFGVRIRGDSMIPFVNDDDIVFVKSQPELEDGEIGIVVLNNSALCKKYCVRDGKVLLVSLNQKYEPIEIKEYDELHFVGKVVGRVTPEENTKV